MTLCAIFLTDEGTFLFADSVRTFKKKNKVKHKNKRTKLFKINKRCGLVRAGVVSFSFKIKNRTRKVKMSHLIKRFRKEKKNAIENLSIQEITKEFHEFIDYQLSGAKEEDTHFMISGYNKGGKGESYLIKRLEKFQPSKDKITDSHRWIGEEYILESVLTKKLSNLNELSIKKRDKELTEEELKAIAKIRSLDKSIHGGNSDYETCKTFFELIINIVSKINKTVGPPIYSAKITKENGFIFMQKPGLINRFKYIVFPHSQKK